MLFWHAPFPDHFWNPSNENNAMIMMIAEGKVPSRVKYLTPVSCLPFMKNEYVAVTFKFLDDAKTRQVFRDNFVPLYNAGYDKLTSPTDPLLDCIY